MGTIRPVEMSFIDDLFEMGGGYVLEFTNQTFAEFFADELNVDIDDPKYQAGGTSKAKRLRFFLKNCEPRLRIRTLLALWEYREAYRRRNRIAETIPDAQDAFNSMIERLGGKRPACLTPMAWRLGRRSAWSASRLTGVSNYPVRPTC